MAEMFTCTICEAQVPREEVEHSLEGLPFCRRCFGLFGQLDFHMPGCALCGPHAAIDQVIAECQASLHSDELRRVEEITLLR